MQAYDLFTHREQIGVHDEKEHEQHQSSYRKLSVAPVAHSLCHPHNSMGGEQEENGKQWHSVSRGDKEQYDGKSIAHHIEIEEKVSSPLSQTQSHPEKRERT